MDSTTLNFLNFREYDIGFRTPLFSKFSYKRLFKQSLFRRYGLVGAWDPGDDVSQQSEISTSHGAIFGLDFSGDGAILGAACEKHSLLFVDPLSRGLIAHVPEAHNNCVNSVKFLDNRMLATCSDDHTIALWDLRNLRSPFRILKGHSSWVKNIEFVRDKGLLVTSGFDSYIYTWDLNRCENEHHNEFSRVFFTPGLMRMRLTPDASKMIISTQWGYLIVIHDLDLDHLGVDLLGFKPNLYWLMIKSRSVFKGSQEGLGVFSAKRNRAELVIDFPPDNDPENITSVTPHPFGWAVLTRNTNHDDNSEWSCLHDIQLPIPEDPAGVLVDPDKSNDFNDPTLEFDSEDMLLGAESARGAEVLTVQPASLFGDDPADYAGTRSVTTSGGSFSTFNFAGSEVRVTTSSGRSRQSQNGLRNIISVQVGSGDSDDEDDDDNDTDSRGNDMQSRARNAGRLRRLYTMRRNVDNEEMDEEDGDNLDMFPDETPSIDLDPHLADEYTPHYGNETTDESNEDIAAANDLEMEEEGDDLLRTRFRGGSRMASRRRRGEQMMSVLTASSFNEDGFGENNDLTVSDRTGLDGVVSPTFSSDDNELDDGVESNRIGESSSSVIGELRSSRDISFMDVGSADRSPHDYATTSVASNSSASASASQHGSSRTRRYYLGGRLIAERGSGDESRSRHNHLVGGYDSDGFVDNEWRHRLTRAANSALRAPAASARSRPNTLSIAERRRQLVIRRQTLRRRRADYLRNLEPDELPANRPSAGSGQSSTSSGFMQRLNAIRERQSLLARGSVRSALSGTRRSELHRNRVDLEGVLSTDTVGEPTLVTADVHADVNGSVNSANSHSSNTSGRLSGGYSRVSGGGTLGSSVDSGPRPTSALHAANAVDRRANRSRSSGNREIRVQVQSSDFQAQFTFNRRINEPSAYYIRNVAGGGGGNDRSPNGAATNRTRDGHDSLLVNSEDSFISSSNRLDQGSSNEASTSNRSTSSRHSGGVSSAVVVGTNSAGQTGNQGGSSGGRTIVLLGTGTSRRRRRGQDGGGGGGIFDDDEAAIPKTYRRLQYFIKEPNVGRGFIKEQSFSPDGRVIASPFGYGLRLLAFDSECRDLSEVMPSVLGPVSSMPNNFVEINSGIGSNHGNVVLCTRFSPTHPLLVSGCLKGKINFYHPIF